MYVAVKRCMCIIVSGSSFDGIVRVDKFHLIIYIYKCHLCICLRTVIKFASQLRLGWMHQQPDSVSVWFTVPVTGSKGKIQFWVNHCGTNRYRYTKRLIIFQTWSSRDLSRGLETSRDPFLQVLVSVLVLEPSSLGLGLGLGTWDSGDSVFVTHEAWNWDKIGIIG